MDRDDDDDATRRLNDKIDRMGSFAGNPTTAKSPKPRRISFGYWRLRFGQNDPDSLSAHNLTRLGFGSSFFILFLRLHLLPTSFSFPTMLQFQKMRRRLTVTGASEHIDGHNKTAESSEDQSVGRVSYRSSITLASHQAFIGLDVFCQPVTPLATLCSILCCHFPSTTCSSLPPSLSLVVLLRISLSFRVSLCVCVCVSVSASLMAWMLPLLVAFCPSHLLLP